MVFERQIVWTGRPEANDAQSKVKLIRCPAKGVFVFYITSAQIHSTRIHYYKGRSRPHTKPSCEACDAGNEHRYKGFIAACNKHDRGQGIIELTAGPADQLYDHLENKGSIRGLIIQLTRPSGRANGLIEITIRKPDIDPEELPKPPNVIQALKKIWQIQDQMPQPDIVDVGTRETVIRHFKGANNGSRKS
jgi:hypothetical protein